MSEGPGEREPVRALDRGVFTAGADRAAVGSAHHDADLAADAQVHIGGRLLPALGRAKPALDHLLAGPGVEDVLR